MSDTPSSTSSTSSTVANHYLCTNTIATPERELVELKRKLADWLNAFKADPFSTGESKVDRLIEVATIESLLADKARLEADNRRLLRRLAECGVHRIDDVDEHLAALNRSQNNAG